MKKVLITQRLIEDEKTGEIAECLDRRWSLFLHRLGIFPQAMSYGIPVANYLSENVSGIILSGGNDLSIVNPHPLNKARDEYECELISSCIEREIPILAVCRGMQLLSNFFGQSPTTLDNHVKVTHDISITPQTRYFLHYPDNLIVNSFHRYGVMRVPDCLRIAATCNDRSIEAFEHNSLPIVGIMWHPERQEPSSQFDTTLIKTLFAA